MTILSCRILLTAYRQRNQIQVLNVNTQNSRQRDQSAKLKSGFFVLVAMVVFYQAAILPASVMHAINYRFFTKEVYYVEDDLVGEIPIFLSYCLAAFNSAINPWMYCLGNGPMKKAVKSFFPCFKPR